MIPSVFMLSSLRMEMAHKSFAMLDHYLASKWPSAVPPRPQVRRGLSTASPSTSTAWASSVPPCGISPTRSSPTIGPAEGRGAQAVLGVDSPRPRRGAGGRGGLRVVPRFARLRLHDWPVADDRRAGHLLVEALQRSALTLVSFVTIVSSSTRREGRRLRDGSSWREGAK
jgi:hypothetical protein